MLPRFSYRLQGEEGMHSTTTQQNLMDVKIVTNSVYIVYSVVRPQSNYRNNLMGKGATQELRAQSSLY